MRINKWALSTIIVGAVIALIGSKANAAGTNYGELHMTRSNQVAIQAVTKLLARHNMEYMLEVFKCESQLVHYELDGTTLLKNRSGSNARGIAQIMTSVHPDKWVVVSYNQKKGTDYDVKNINLSNTEDYTLYAIMLATIHPKLSDWAESRRCWISKITKN